VTEDEAKGRPFAEIVQHIVRVSETVPDYEIIGFLKGTIQAIPGLSDPDREALFSLTARAGIAAKPLERGDVNVNVKNVQNANSSATASPHVSQTVVTPSTGSAVSSESTGVADDSANDVAVAAKEERDGLTTLRRREVFDADLPVLLADARGKGEPMSLIMMDVDKFKSVNDTLGHPKGDAVLKDVGRAVEMVAADKGFAYRYGGEEISLLLPNHDMQAAAMVAERLRAVVEALQPGGLTVTASFGVATYPEHTSKQDELVVMADRALYVAKEKGRNRVCAHGDTSVQ